MIDSKWRILWRRFQMKDHLNTHLKSRILSRRIPNQGSSEDEFQMKDILWKCQQDYDFEKIQDGWSVQDIFRMKDLCQMNFEWRILLKNSRWEMSAIHVRNEGSSQNIFRMEDPFRLYSKWRILSGILPNERSFQDASQVRDPLKILSQGSSSWILRERSPEVQFHMDDPRLRTLSILAWSSHRNKRIPPT